MQAPSGSAARAAADHDAELLRIACVLLLVQAAVATLTLLGELVFAALTGALVWILPIGLLSLGQALALVMAAAGVVARRRWARSWALLLEWITLAFALLALVAGLIPQLDTGDGLTATLTNVAVPIILISVLMRPGVRALFPRRLRARRARRSSSAAMTRGADAGHGLASEVTR